MDVKIFIGYDTRERIAYDVLKYSILKNTKLDVDIIPLYHKELRRQGYFKRPWEQEAKTGNFRDLIDARPFSTEFSHTRFLVPELCGFEGWALFLDCDMVFTTDIQKLFDKINNKYAIMCVKHRQDCKSGKKMDGAEQQRYYRKNWSSFMLINCGHEKNKSLTKEIVNMQDGGWLHAFAWLHDDDIGALPGTYNWIEDSPVSSSNGRPNVIHYTYGGPWFHLDREIPYQDVWWHYYKGLMASDLYDPSDEFLHIKYGVKK